MDSAPILAAARAAAFAALRLSTEEKNAVLLMLAEHIRKAERELLTANARDIATAEAKGQNAAYVDRLTLTPARIAAMADSVETVMHLPDPVGERFEEHRLDNGMMLSKMRVPIGVILMVYESRPNVTIDAFSLCFKSGNVTLLKGGSLSKHTNLALLSIIHTVLAAHDMDVALCTYLELERHEDLEYILRQQGDIDLVVPRGGDTLIRSVVDNSRIPVIFHYQGINHLYIDKAADLDQARRLVVNSKVNRPGTCNAVEGILVHAEVAREFLPDLVDALFAHEVTVRGCPRSVLLEPRISPATESDWDTEFLDLTMVCKVTPSLDEAISWINAHGSQHTEGIVTTDHRTAERFVREVDAGTVFVNASTRLNDGGVFGMGAELGISTQKLHARGPMGLRELTSYKWVGEGTGQIRE